MSNYGKESACHTGDTGSVPGLGRSPGERNGTHSSITAWRTHGWRSLVGYSPQGCKELDTAERLTQFPHTWNQYIIYQFYLNLKKKWKISKTNKRNTWNHVQLVQNSTSAKSPCSAACFFQSFLSLFPKHLVFFPFFFFLKQSLFNNSIYLFLAVLGLCCCFGFL